jgi:steroid 5-alpha reductase family enzyme
MGGVLQGAILSRLNKSLDARVKHIKVLFTMEVIDYLTVGPYRAGAAAAGIMLALVWLISVRIKDASIIDMFWGLGFAVIAAASLLVADNLSGWGLAIGLTVIAWGVRLFMHLGTRWLRDGEEDYRYQKMRAYHGSGFWWRSLFVVFLLQFVLMWIVALPVMGLMSTGGPSGAPLISALGLLIAFAGLIMETLADIQLTKFRETSRKGQLLDYGWWSRTRHPNYFGDALFWWGVFIAIIGTSPEVIWTIIGPILMNYLLVNVSGVKMLERNLIKKPGYAEYMQRTNRFVPRIF